MDALTLHTDPVRTNCANTIAAAMPDFQSDFVLSSSYLYCPPASVVEPRSVPNTAMIYPLARVRTEKTSSPTYLTYISGLLPSLPPPHLFEARDRRYISFCMTTSFRLFQPPLSLVPGLPTSSSASLSYETVGRVPDEAVVSGRSRVSDQTIGRYRAGGSFLTPGLWLCCMTSSIFLRYMCPPGGGVCS